MDQSLAAGQGLFDAFDLYFLAMCHMKLGDQAKANEYFDRAEQWAKDRKDISPMNAVELKVFRSEAEALLKSGVQPKPPSGSNKL